MSVVGSALSFAVTLRTRHELSPMRSSAGLYRIINKNRLNTILVDFT